MPLSSTDANNLITAEVDAIAYTGSTPIFFGLFTGIPASTSNELTGGQYGRQVITFTTTPSAGQVVNQVVVSFTSMPSSSSVTSVALVSSSSVGQRLLWSSSISPTTFNGGETFQFSTGAITATIS